MPALASLTDYHLLGRTGLRVSPLCLGAMTFGDPEGWGADEGVSRGIFDRYLDAGGNFIDTANAYTKGRSETLLGQFFAESGGRDRAVLATKFSITTSPGDPNASGNGRKTIYRSLEASLRRLQTDYVDLYWMHYWDTLTPVEEVVDTLDDLVRGGKIRYYGFSDVPAWYLARAQSYAEFRGKTRLAAAQLEYSLIDRNIETEHVAAARELGIGICVWGPLSSGLLTGKYRGGAPQEKARITTDPHYGRLLNERNARIVDALVEVAGEIGRPPSQVALNWVTRRPGVRSTIIGATKLGQLEENLTALEFDIPAELTRRLDEASHVPPAHLYDFFTAPLAERLRAANVSARPEWDRWT